MFVSTGRAAFSFSQRCFGLFGSLILLGSLSAVAFAQGSVDYTGTGGRHIIQGIIYFPSGRRLDAPGLKVKLESLTAGGNLSVFADSNGSFSFKNLSAGSYTIVIDGTDDYDTVRETVYIDDPGSSSLRGRTAVTSTPRPVMVPIYLLPKRGIDRKSGVLNAVLATVPKAAADLYLQALESAAAENNQRAIEQLKAALQIYAQFPLALNELGVQYLKTNQADKAAETLSLAVKIVPEEFNPRLNYGVALLNQKNFAAAEEELRIAAQRNSAAPTAHMYLGIALAHQKKLEEAEKELLLAIASKSNEVAQAHRFLGGVYWARRDYKRAADQLEAYLKLTPKAADAERTRSAIKELRSKQAGG